MACRHRSEAMMWGGRGVIVPHHCVARPQGQGGSRMPLGKIHMDACQSFRYQATDGLKGGH